MMNTKRLLSLIIAGPIVVCSAFAVAQTSTAPPPDPQPQRQPPRSLPDLQVPPTRTIGTPPPAPPASAVSPQIGPGAVPGRLQNNLRGLDVGRANLRDVRGERRRSRSPGVQSGNRSSAFQSFQRRVEEARRRREAEMRDLEDRFRKVEELLRYPPQSQIPRPITEPPGPRLPVPGQTPPPPTPVPDKPTPAAPSDSATAEPPKPDEPEVPEIPDKSTEPDAEIVTDSAINRLALADNLFGSNDIENALRLYVELSREPGKVDAGDRLWIDYQIACSSRRLKKYDQARKFYRKVVSAKNGGVYPKLAKWWLEAMQRKEGYETKHAAIRMELDLK